MDKNYEQIYRAELNEDKQIIKVVPSEFNLPKGKSRTSGLIGISQDNNIAYVSDMKLTRFEFYKTYLGKSIFGKAKWKYEKEKIKNYKNGGIFIDYVMSYDGNVVILGYKEKSDMGDLYKEDLYVSIKDAKGNWSPFKHMGFDINTLGTETPCYLAPDNKTLYFSSSGRIGFGQGDIYITRRLDDSWTNWSEPLNLGNSVNSFEHENSFVIDGQSGRIYFIRWEDDVHTNIYTSELYVEPPAPIEQPPLEIPTTDSIPEQDTVAIVQITPPPTPEPVMEEEIMPEPVIIIRGITTNKKNGEIIQAEIKYYDIYTGQVIGKVISNAETGEYSLILRKGIYYSFDANADNFIGESHSLNTTELKDFGKIEQNFELTPIEKDVTIRLNNIFFETDKSELLPASFTELDKLLGLLNKNSNIKIEISGHTDDVGSESYNQKLSERRANAVRDYLISKGIKAERIVAKGYGEAKPVVENNSTENRALNRRVEFTILEIGK
ncbi:MAG: OmpA family protein [Bacteroidetes bacterium]|nr:OmpA family protein [Bacteroidota bacterium]